MKIIHVFYLVLAVLCLLPDWCGAKESAGLQTLATDSYLLDLRATPWEFVADPKGIAKLEAIRQRQDWAPVTVGRSWDLAGHGELRKGAVWVRTRVMIPAALQGDRIAFFCTAMGGRADLFLNGTQVGERVQYSWGNDVPGPFRIELTNALNYGKTNEILIRTDPTLAIRSIGLLGLVCLSRTVPFERTPEGGLVLQGNPAGKFNVLLHYGDAVLAQGQKTEFSPAELAALKLPVYALRQDELILVAPSGAYDVSKRLKVDAALIHHTTDARPLAVRCPALPSAVRQFELLTVPLQVAGSYRNPFEPREVDVTAQIQTPSGKTETVHAFFAQDYRPVSVGVNQEILLPVRGLGTPWRFNYRPRETGRHTVRLAVKDRTGKAEFDAGGFEATPQAHRGYLRVSKRDPRFFEFDNGDSFYATGPSGWFRQTENWMFGGNTRWIPIEAHKKYYERKAANHSSFEYLARWHFGQMVLKGGLIDNYVVWKVDQAVRAMEANGVYWITYGRPASGRTFYNNIKWRRNVMSSQPQIVRQNGLPPLEELGPETGGRIELFHFVSRLADSPAIWIWNCAEEDGSFNPAVLPYHDTIRSLDVYHHPHGVSEGRDSVKHGSDAVLLPDWYGQSFEKCAAQYAALTGIQAPVLDVEGSLNTSDDLTGIVARLERVATEYHNHLWLCLFLKMAGGGTDWFNNELDTGNRLFHAKSIARFLDGEHLTKTRWEIAAPSISDPLLRAFALRSPGKTLVWIVRPPGARAAAGEGGPTLRIPVAGTGTYQLEFWDTHKGVVTERSTAEAKDHFVSCPLQAIAADVALKVAAAKP